MSSGMSYLANADTEKSTPDGQNSQYVDGTSRCMDPLRALGTTTSTQGADNSPEEFIVTPANLRNKIRGGVVAMLFPALIVLGGLSGSGKSSFLRNILSMEGANPEKFPAFCQNLIVSTGFTTLSKKQYSAEVETQQSLCYSLISGIRSHLRTIGAKITFPDSVFDPSKAYDKESMQKAAKLLYDCLQELEIEPVQPYMPTNPQSGHGALRIANLKKVLHMGVWTSCLWELTVNRTALRFLECFRGHLYNSFVWLFVDLDRDFDKLYDSPDPITHDNPYAMHWRPRLHYLLRASCLSENPKLKRNQVCRLIAIHKGSLDETDKRIEKLKEEAMNAAAHYGLSDLIDFEIHLVDISSKESQMKAYHFFVNFLKDSRTESIDLSWIFLRLSLLFYQETSMFMEFDYLFDLATHLGFDKDNVKKFLKFYTSFGSLLYVGLVDQSSPYIILDPAKFLLNLCNLLASSYLKYGVINQSQAMEIFGKENEKYFAILMSVGLAAKVLRNEAILPSDCQLDEGDTFFYYMSVVRGGKPDEKNLPEAVQLVSGLRSPAMNMQTAFTKQLLKEAFLLVPCEEMNVTKFEYGVVKIEFVVQGDVVEIRIDPKDCGIDQLDKICDIIVQAIKEIAELRKERGGKFEYQLRHICRRKFENDSCKCIVCHKYHILTNQLDICDCNPYEGLQVHQHFKIAVEMSRLKDTQENISFSKITADDVMPLAKQIQHNEKDIAVLSHILETGEDHHHFSGHDWYDVLTIIMDWKERSPKPSKENLAKLLLDASMNSKPPLEKRQVELFEKMARNLHLQTYSAVMQHKHIGPDPQ